MKAPSILNHGFWIFIVGWMTINPIACVDPSTYHCRCSGSSSCEYSILLILSVRILVQIPTSIGFSSHSCWLKPPICWFYLKCHNFLSHHFHKYLVSCWFHGIPSLLVPGSHGVTFLRLPHNGGVSSIAGTCTRVLDVFPYGK